LNFIGGRLLKLPISASGQFVFSSSISISMSKRVHFSAKLVIHCPLHIYLENGPKMTFCGYIFFHKTFCAILLMDFVFYSHILYFFPLHMWHDDGQSFLTQSVPQPYFLTFLRQSSSLSSHVINAGQKFPLHPEAQCYENKKWLKIHSDFNRHAFHYLITLNKNNVLYPVSRSIISGRPATKLIAIIPTIINSKMDAFIVIRISCVVVNNKDILLQRKLVAWFYVFGIRLCYLKICR